MTVVLHEGDCLEILKTLPNESIDSVVTDPPYHLTTGKAGGSGLASLNPNSPAGRARIGTGFMGKSWDGGDIAFRIDTWMEILRVLKPGGHLLSFSGTRTYHRMAVAIEDAGFEIRDQIGWLFGTGFPKSLDVSKAIDKSAGAIREVIGFDATKYRPNRDKYLLADQPGGGGKLKADNGATVTAPATDAARDWQGWGTALKPAMEPICVARKPLIGTVVENVLTHGTGALNIDASRIPIDATIDDPRLGGNGTWGTGKMAKNVYEGGYAGDVVGSSPLGRWPANIIHDGSDEVLDAFAVFGESKSRAGTRNNAVRRGDMTDIYGGGKGIPQTTLFSGHEDNGTAARFFYCAKASKTERQGSTHPTIKPVSLMRYLCRLVTPKGGVVLDPFAGSGTTGQAAMEEGFDAILIEREVEYCQDIRHRLAMFM